MQMNLFHHRKYLTALLILFSGAILFRAETWEIFAQSTFSSAKEYPRIPLDFEDFNADIKKSGLDEAFQDKSKLTINWALQNSLDHFLKTQGNHIGAAVVIETATGNVLALAQGRLPKMWLANSHTSLYPNFPAASLFKTVSAAAAFEEAYFSSNQRITLPTGCQHLRENGAWWQELTGPKNIYQLTLKEAFGESCNGYFAKLGINHLGLDLINKYAQRFKWGQRVPADFTTYASPIEMPNPLTTSMQVAGRYAAGFGNVGLSAVHAAWIYLALANQGQAKPLQIFANTPQKAAPNISAIEQLEQIVKPETSVQLREIMAATVQGGTARGAFGSKKYRHLQQRVGGKTGTLTGQNPLGLTTWFVGMMPLDKPEVVVATVSVTEDRWVVKAPHIAAEAFLQYELTKAPREADLPAGGAAARAGGEATQSNKNPFSIDSQNDSTLLERQLGALARQLGH
jgi:peptidoglycan glycosyltransferase